MTDKTIKQIAFVGKKTVPPSYRRDDWKPLAQVSFPSRTQTLLAYRKLREFRMMHELCWRDEQTRYIPNRIVRSRQLMDQKANSIADLSAVLYIQRQKGKEMTTRVDDAKAKLKAIRSRRWAEFEELARRARSGELEKVERSLSELEAKNAIRPAGSSEKEGMETYLVSLRKMINRMRQARRVIARAKTVPRVKILEKLENSWPKRRHGKSRIDALNSTPAPISLEGVSIKWADLLDAEHAKDWPEEVTHDTMGIHDYVAPRSKAQPSLVIMTKDDVYNRIKAMEQ